MKKTFKQFLLEIQDIQNSVSYQKNIKLPDSASDKTIRHIKNITNNPKVIPKGSGSQGYVYQHDDPNKQGEVVRVSDKYEATTIYLRYLYDNPELQSNPFFPKIKQAIRPNSDVPSYVIEQLYDVVDSPIGFNMLHTLIKKYFTTHQTLAKYEMSDYYFVTSIFAEIIEDSIKFNDYKEIKDPQLKQACQIINKLYVDLLRKDPDTRVDIHTGNIMWRITKFGPQLVITDPLWFRK